MSLLKHILNYSPPMLLVAFTVLFYYIYVIEYCVFYLNASSTQKRTVYLIIFHILFVMFNWSLWESMCTKHHLVPYEYRVSATEHEQIMGNEGEKILRKLILERNLRLYTRSDYGNIRYCRHCRHIKPDRTHHCSACGECIVRMDHHCPWIANCVGFRNHKQFILLLFYLTIFCLFYVLSMVEYASVILQNFRSMTQIILACGMLMAIVLSCLISILFFYNLNMLLRNVTTLEWMRYPVFISTPATSFNNNNNINSFGSFNLGVCGNFKEVFGDSWYLWFIPIHTAKGDGCEFNIT